MAKERIVYLDLAKFVAITLVCVSHCYFLTDINNPVCWIISSFYMPLFMLMCGFFSKSSFQLPINDFLKKKTVQLLIPAVICSILSCLILSIFGKPLLNWKELYGSVWFLKTLFACYLIVFFIKKVISKDWLACLISSILLIVLPFGYTLMISYMLLFFWTGFFIRKYYSEYQKNIEPITFISGVIFVLSCILGFAHPQVPFELQTVLGAPLMCLIQYVVALAGSLFVLGGCYYVSEWLKNSLLLAFLSKVGQYTLGIYVVQTIILERLFLNIFHLDTYTSTINYLIIPMLGILFCFISYWLVQILKRSSSVNLFFFGNQYS